MAAKEKKKKTRKLLMAVQVQPTCAPHRHAALGPVQSATISKGRVEEGVCVCRRTDRRAAVYSKWPPLEQRAAEEKCAVWMDYMELVSFRWRKE